MRLGTRSITIGALCAVVLLSTAGHALAKTSATTLGNDVSPWAIACSSAGNCAVAGTYAYASPFPELTIFNQKNGVWQKGVALKLPKAQSSDEWELAATDLTDYQRMDDVACPANGDCVAVGEYIGSDGNIRFVRFTEKNGSWQGGVLLDLPGNATKPEIDASLSATADVSLDSVSCASVGNCAVVGYYQAGDKLEGMLFTEVGGKWSRGVEAPLPGTAPAAEVAGLNDVSCSTDGTCTATGSWTTSSGVSDPWTLIEYNGTVLSSVSVALPAGADTTPADDPLAGGTAISCVDAGDCLSGGYYSDQFDNSASLLLSETGGTWSSAAVTLPAQAAPSSSANAQSSSVGPVSCTAVGDCSGAVSFKDTFNNGQIGVFTETGGTVGAATEVQLPSNAATDHQGDETADASMLSCSSPGDCVLVGSYNNSVSDVLPLYTVEQAGTWSTGIEGDEPSNAGAQSGGLGLELVNCPASGACTAIGAYQVGTHNLEGYAVAMNGGNWGEPGELDGSGVVAHDYDLALSLLVDNDDTTLKKLKAANGFATDAVFLKAGTQTADWYATVNGRSTLIASLSKTGKALREYSVKVKLTAAGKALLDSAKSVKVTASGTYAATGVKTVRMTEHFKLK